MTAGGGEAMRVVSWSGRGWSVEIGADVAVTAQGKTTVISGKRAEVLQLRRRFFSWRLRAEDVELVKLRRIPRGDLEALRRRLRLVLFRPEVAAVVTWYRGSVAVLGDFAVEQRWIPSEVTARIVGERPRPGLGDEIRRAGCEGDLTDEEAEALRFLEIDVEAHVERLNEQILAAELRDRRQFFATIERSPLTDEQAEAVVCFDNRVQLLAAAGSGKTSVMVARAAYAVARGFVAPDRILLLAFNSAAADELQQRVNARFAAAGLSSAGVRASTFHAFGLDVIGRAMGARPRLASWIEHGDGTDMVMRIVDELRDASEEFRYKWDLYRTIFAKAPTKLEDVECDGYDKETKRRGHQTAAGEVVKSYGERMIADFMYFNGVDYEYERAYSVNTADATHGQYRPDFYYPAADVWHEHWALDSEGRPPAEFGDYLAGIEWKRSVHRRHGTTLIESTWADVVFGGGLSRLRRDLEARGVAFDWNPDRSPQQSWVKPFAHNDLARLVRTFMTHVKSSALNRNDLEQRLRTASGRDSYRGYRSQLFLDIYWPIHEAWESRLRQEGTIDFEDMLVQAAHLVEAGRYVPEFDLVLVDEFQDASRARARLVRGLVDRSGRYLLAVGDDWQAINRFAGADISVMRDFERWFGRSRRLALTTTFRCPQTICDVATRFVAKNPGQIPKVMRSAKPGASPPVRIVEGDSSQGVAAVLEEISGRIAPRRASVNVLGRYRFQRELLPGRTPGNLEVTFRTIHGSKGLEADFIIVVGLESGTYGFPSTITDDPVLALAMPQPDLFEHAEERRLFYVALTRAREEVVLFASPTRTSAFVAEIIPDPDVDPPERNGRSVDACPACGQGVIVTKRGPYGSFRACSAFPRCDYKPPGNRYRRR